MASNIICSKFVDDRSFFFFFFFKKGISARLGYAKLSTVAATRVTWKSFKSTNFSDVILLPRQSNTGFYLKLYLRLVNNRH